jgi:hypothetical protein
MNLLRYIKGISVLLIMTFFMLSCKKDSIDDNNTYHDKYIIEMDSGYRLSRVTHIIDKNIVEYEKSYEYSEKYVNVQIKNGSLSTYFLNQTGLADSCHEGTNTIQYHYDQNSFLTSYSYPNGSIINYEYADGNKIKLIWGSNKSYYQYNSQLNLVDIDIFNGTYLGKLNKNLLQRRQMEFLMASNGSTTTYQYTLNSSGLVSSRIGTTTYNSVEPQKKSISEFEYIINK